MMSCVPADIRIGGDVAKYAVALLRAVASGWTPPSNVSEQLYHDVRTDKENYPPELVGFVVYCCSYSGKLWGGYGRNGNPVKYRKTFQNEAYLNVLKQAKGLSGVQFYVGAYDDVDYAPGSTVYMDPPYAGTTKYADEFDHDRFWQFCRSLSATCRVFVSEYHAPPEWRVIWEKSVTSSLDRDTGSKRATEKLFQLSEAT